MKPKSTRPSMGPTIMIMVVVMLMHCGCARSLRTIDDARDAFATGNLASARDTLNELSDKGGRFSDAAALDLSIVELASGDVAAAESRLRKLRNRFDLRPGFAPVREAAAIVTDDTSRMFRPAGYEEVMIRSMLAICSLASDRVDAQSYALQANSKQAELARDAQDRGQMELADAYQPIAIAPYLRGMLREATHRDYDDAARAYQLVSSVRPQFAPAEADIARAASGTHSAGGHGVLYVLACVGRGPVLQETTAPTTSTALSIASSVLNAETNKETTDEGEKVGGPVLPNIAAVKVPAVVIPPSDVAAIGVRIGGTLYGATQTLTDVGELAVKQNKAEMPWTIARAVVRRATKETTVAKLTDSIGLSGSAGSLFHFAAASTWSGTEHADTRCWGLLPREIQVFRVELRAGQHEIDLEALGFNGAVLGPHAVTRQTVRIVDGKNSYVVVIAPREAMYVLDGTRDG